jgi:hypothetical protein
MAIDPLRGKVGRFLRHGADNLYQPVVSSPAADSSGEFPRGLNFRPEGSSC